MSTISMHYYDPSDVLDILMERFAPNTPRSPVFFAGPFSGRAQEQEKNENVADDNTPTQAAPRFKPCMDVYKDSDSNIVTVIIELPGMRKDGINIEVHDGRLYITGERVVREGWKDEGFSVRERGWGRFKRSILLPKRVKYEEVKARFEDGLLTITFPKNAPEEAPRKIIIDH